MLYAIIVVLVLAVGWLGFRRRRLSRGLAQLSDAVAKRSPYLVDSSYQQYPSSSWKPLTDNVNELIREVSRLDTQQAGQLDQLETTLGSLYEAVLVIDSDNYVMMANDAFRRIFAADSDFVGRRVESALGNTDFLSFLEDVRKAEAIPRREIKFSSGDRVVWVEATGTELKPRADEGNRRLCLFVFHDISQHRQLEDVRKEFVGNVSHELKTPIAVIKGYAETLVDDHTTMQLEDRSRFLQAIYRHSIRLAAIVEDLLTISRLESDSGPVELPEQDLGRLLRGLSDEHSHRLVTTGHELIVQDVGEELIVRFDSLRMAQVLANLIDNAQKYCPSGCTIRVGVDVRENEVEVSVADDGPGIPEADRTRIFERFYRVEKGRSRESGGTGLGLSIVKHIVQTHGGRTWVESEVGKGTRFVFAVPLVRPSHAPESIESAKNASNRAGVAGSS